MKSIALESLALSALACLSLQTAAPAQNISNPPTGAAKVGVDSSERIGPNASGQKGANATEGVGSFNKGENNSNNPEQMSPFRSHVQHNNALKKRFLGLKRFFGQKADSDARTGATGPVRDRPKAGLIKANSPQPFDQGNK